MKVRAKAVGQHNGRIVEIGDVFDVEPNHIKPYWMEEVIETPVAPTPKPKKEKFKLHFKVPYFEIRIGGEQ